MDAITGGSARKQADLAKLQQESTQRRQLADLARQQAETDQAASGKTGRKTGSQLLTYLSGLSGDGTASLGGA